MLASLKATRHPVETGVLVGLCFFLPLLEAPKNLLWLAYLALWVANRARSRDWGGRWDGWDTLIAAWIGSGFVVAAFAGVQGEQWKGAGDLFRYGSVLWLVKRSGYGRRELRWALGALVASVVIGLVVGYARLWSGIGKSGYLQLHSVGHVNHSAIYAAMMLGVCAAWLFARWRDWLPGRRALALAVTVLVGLSVIVMASRAAVGVGLVLLIVLAFAWWPLWRAPALASVLAVLVAAGGAMVTGAQVWKKQEQNVAAQNVLAYRDGVWRMALAAWERHPLFGLGMDNYSRMKLADVERWRKEAGKPFRAEDYYVTSHAHSLYANTLAERGLAGAGALAAVLLAWLVALARRRPRRGMDPLDALLWGGAASAWIVTTGVGLANTTLHHEHGLLAALLLGLWLARNRARAT